MKKIVILIFACLMLTGCYSYKEISNLNIVNSVGIDITENEVIVSLNTIEMINNRSVIKTYSDSGKTIADALLNIDGKIKKEIYLGHLQAVILGSDTAKDSLDVVIDYFNKEAQVNKEFYIFALESNAYEFFDENIEINTLNETNITGNNNKYSKDYKLNLNINYKKLLVNYLDNNSYHIPILRKVTSDENVLYEIKQVFLYRVSIYEGKLDDETTKIYALLNENKTVLLSLSKEQIDVSVTLVNKKIENDNITLDILVNNKDYEKQVREILSSYLDDYYKTIVINIEEGDL